MQRLLFLLLLMCLPVRTPAQPICKMQTFTVDDGLSQSFVQRLFQDSDGLLWLCTWNGLDSYDGYSFTNYNMSSNGGKALTTNRITKIAPTRRGDIWCNTYGGGIFLFQKKTHTFANVLGNVEQKLGRKACIDKIYTLKNGVTWLVGTDGYHFRVDEDRMDRPEGITVFSPEKGNLKGKNILNISLDKENDEWVLTDKGVNIVGNKTLEDNTPFCLFKEKNGHIFLFTADGRMGEYDRKAKTVRTRRLPEGFGRVHSVSGLPHGYIGIAAAQGLLLYSICQQTFHTYALPAPAGTGNTPTLYYNAHECWVLTDHARVVRIDLRTLAHKDYNLPASPYAKDRREGRSLLFAAQDSTLWAIPSTGAMCWYDKETDGFKPYLQNDADPASVIDPLVRFYTFDRQGNLWFASNIGLVKLSFIPRFYKLHPHESNMDIRAFLTDSLQRVWVGSQSGVVRVYPKTGGTPRYLSANGRLLTERCTFAKGAYSFLQDHTGNIWIGTKGSGLFRLHPLTDNHFEVTHFRHRPNDAYSLGSNNIYSLHEDNRGRIWIGTFGNGLNLLDDTGRQARFIHPGNEWRNTYPESGLKVRHITSTPDGVLLVGTHDGLLTIAPDWNHWQNIRFYCNRHRTGQKSSLNGNDVMHIFRTNQGTLYASVFAGGLNRIVSGNLLSDSIRFEHVGPAEGLLSSLVHSMFEDREGNLWVVAENVLAKYDTRSGLFANYWSSTFQRGLKFSEALPLPVGGNRFLVGTNRGVLEINPGMLGKDNYVPAVLFTDVRVQGIPLQGDANCLSRLELEPSQRNIMFSFSAIDMIGAQDIQYAYRLQGVENNWNEVGKTRTAGYMNLPAGTYQLEVKSTNSHGVWMDNVHSLTLEVKPTFGETVWSWLLYGLLSAALVAIILYVLFYIFHLRHRIDLEQQLADIKLRFFTDISHELRTPLTLISGPVDEVLHDPTLSDRSRENLVLVRNNVVRMLRLITQILDFRKIQNKKMKAVLEETELIHFLKQLMLNFRPLAEEQNIRFELQTDLEEVFLWLDRDKADKIFFNLVSNAFKYTPVGQSICIEVHKAGEHVEVTVADTGIGIAADKQERIFHRFENIARGGFDFWKPSSGIGLSLVKEMANLLHGGIRLQSTPGKGSRFTVWLPLQRTAYDNDSDVEFILDNGRTNLPDSHPDDAGLPEPDAHNHGNQELPTLLVVEDNRELRRFLANILSGHYRVVEAVDGRDGWEKACSIVPDLIVTDMMMPVMDGLELIKQLKQNLAVCHIPVIILSAKDSLDDRIAGFEENIDDYIAKPFNATYLKTRIAALLRRQKQLQEVFRARMEASFAPQTGNSDGSAGNSPAGYAPSMPETTPLDEQFINQVIGFLEQNIGNADIKIEDFAGHLCLSRTVFYRKLKTITGLTPVEFVREIRLKRALQLMATDRYTVSQVAYMVGFSDPNYFGRCFKKKMGVSPTEYKHKE